MNEIVAQALRYGLEPARAAEKVLTAIRDDQFYVFTHPDIRTSVEQRFDEIRAAFDQA